MDADEYKRRRGEREKALKDARAARDAKDLDTLDALEEKMGLDNVFKFEIPVPPPAPLPAVVILKRPEVSDFKMWQTIMTKATSTASEKAEAHEDFARAVLLYPDDKTIIADLFKACSGLSVGISGEAGKIAGGVLTQRGKE
jgi:hypothetical protein